VGACNRGNESIRGAQAARLRVWAGSPKRSLTFKFATAGRRRQQASRLRSPDSCDRNLWQCVTALFFFDIPGDRE